jgi:hypothetical protein
MATFKQKKAINLMVENRGNVSKAMRDAGYSPATAENPDKLTKSQGFKELMEEAGLTPDLIVTSLVSDIKAKPKQRVGEMRLGADLLGLIKRESPITAVQINIGEDREKYA